MISSLIGFFYLLAKWLENSKAIKAKKQFWVINIGRQLVQILYLYWNLVYYIMYSIMEPYKNYSNQLRTLAYNCFNKVLSKLWIKVEYGFTLY